MKTLLLTGLVVLTGCASPDYAAYSNAQIQIAAAKADADKARSAALIAIAGTSDVARVAAVMSLQNTSQMPAMQVAAPKTTGEMVLQWASVLAPTISNAYSVGKNAVVQIEQSKNSALVAQSTNAAFVGIASQIQAPGATTTTTTNTTNTTTTTVSDSYNSTSTDSTHTPTVVTQPAPVIVTQPAPVIVTQPAPIVVPVP